MGIIDWARKSSPWVYHFCCGGGCNGCDIAVLATICPKFDPERLGVVLKGSPRHADMLLMTGTITKKMKNASIEVHNQVPEPKVVIAVGNCANTGEIFRQAYGTVNPPDKYIPIDVYIPGCPPRPQAIIKGIARALEILVEKGRSK